MRLPTLFPFLPALLTPCLAQADNRMTLPALEGSGTSAGWVVWHEPFDGPTSPHARVTDAALHVIGWDESPKEALTGPDQPGRDPLDWVFAVGFSLVADGKLYLEGSGICSPWEEDISICVVECDGGQFALRRTTTPEATWVTAILTPMPDIFAGGTDASISIQSCGEGGVIRLDRIDDVPSGITFVHRASQGY